MKFSYYDIREFHKFLSKLSVDGCSRVAAEYKMIKKIEPGLVEIRVSLSHGISRFIYFKEIGDRYIIINSFIKKSQKTPLIEIRKARSRRRNYHDRNR